MPKERILCISVNKESVSFDLLRFHSPLIYWLRLDSHATFSTLVVGLLPSLLLACRLVIRPLSSESPSFLSSGTLNPIDTPFVEIGRSK